MASTTFRFLKFGTSRQIFFQILCSKKNFENFFWSDQKTGLTARRVHYGPFRSPRSISGPYQKMTIPLLNSPKPHPLLSVVGGLLYSEDRGPQDDPKFWTPRILIFGGLGGWKFLGTFFGVYWHNFYLIKFLIRTTLFLASM